MKVPENDIAAQPALADSLAGEPQSGSLAEKAEREKNNESEQALCSKFDYVHVLIFSYFFLYDEFCNEPFTLWIPGNATKRFKQSQSVFCPILPGTHVAEDGVPQEDQCAKQPEPAQEDSPPPLPAPHKVPGQDERGKVPGILRNFNQVLSYAFYMFIFFGFDPDTVYSDAVLDHSGVARL